jgi:hypothetical protein
MITTAYIHTYIHLWLLINTHHVGFKSYERERERSERDQHPSCWIQRIWETQTQTDTESSWVQLNAKAAMNWCAFFVSWSLKLHNVGIPYLLGKWKESDPQSEKNWNQCGEKMVAGRGSSCMYTYLRRWTAQRSIFWTARLRRGATDMPSRPVVADMPKQTLETFRKPPCASSWAFSRAWTLACLLRFFQRNSIAISSAKESPHRIVQNQQLSLSLPLSLSLQIIL